MTNKTDAKTKKFRLLLLLPFLIAGLIMLSGILRHGINLPVGDEWEMVTLFHKVDNGSIGFSDVWEQHNEHRIVFPKLVLLASAYATHWNTNAELLISFLFSLITALMLYLFVLYKLQNRILSMLAAALIAAWFFSPVQYENWLWGWQVEWFMCIACGTLSFFLLDRLSVIVAGHRRAWLMAGAMLSALVATFSLGSGMLIWVVGLGVLKLHKQPKRLLLVWLAGFTLSILAYYYHYHKPAGNPSTTLFLSHPLDFGQYVITYFGRPVTGNLAGAELIGAILLLLMVPLGYALWVRRQYIQKYIPWLALMTLALLTALFTAVARFGFGLDQALASRYTAFALLYVIGLTGLACSLLDHRTLNPQRKTCIVLIALAISVPLLFSSYQNGITGANRISKGLKEEKYCLSQPRPTEECLLTGYPKASLIQKRLDYTKQKHWAGF